MTHYEMMITALAIGIAIFSVTVFAVYLNGVYGYNIITDKEGDMPRILMRDTAVITIFILNMIAVFYIAMWQVDTEARIAEAKALELEQSFSKEKTRYNNIDTLAEYIARRVRSDTASPENAEAFIIE